MARRRYISTDISLDSKLNRVSDFAALLYTWGIAHARDDCRISPQNAEEVRNRVVPGRNKSVEEVEKALLELVGSGLNGIDEKGEIYYPSNSFYKYQTYINAANRRETPQNAASLSPSLSPSLKEDPSCILPKGRSDKKRKTQFPENFEVKPELLLWALEHQISDPGKELEAFRDYHTSKGNSFIDWNAAFRTWLRNSKKFGTNGKPTVQEQHDDRFRKILRRGL